jgi:hypothetical protein
LDAERGAAMLTTGGVLKYGEDGSMSRNNALRQEAEGNSGLCLE